MIKKKQKITTTIKTPTVYADSMETVFEVMQSLTQWEKQKHGQTYLNLVAQYY